MSVISSSVTVTESVLSASETVCRSTDAASEAAVLLTELLYELYELPGCVCAGVSAVIEEALVLVYWEMGTLGTSVTVGEVGTVVSSAVVAVVVASSGAGSEYAVRLVLSRVGKVISSVVVVFSVS